MPKWAIIIRIYYYELKRSKFYYLCFIYPTSYIYIPLLSVLKHLNDNFTFWAKDFSLKKCYAAQIFIHFVRYFELEIFFTQIMVMIKFVLQHDMSQQCLYKLNQIPFFLIKLQLNWIDFELKNYSSILSNIFGETISMKHLASFNTK